MVKRLLYFKAFNNFYVWKKKTQFYLYQQIRDKFQANISTFRELFHVYKSL